VSEVQVSQPAPAVPKELQRGWRGLFYRLRAGFLPEIHRFEGEEDKLVIRMAPYRKQVPLYGLYVSGGLGILALITGILDLVFLKGVGFSVAGTRVTLGILALALAFLALSMAAEFAKDLLIYAQWQFILTNRRIILTTPDPDKLGYADAIYLKGGKIQVLDTNWSKNPFWGAFQAVYGSRDVVLSMSGYEFSEQGARVKGGLRFPDVMPEDIIELEKLIFG